MSTRPSVFEPLTVHLAQDERRSEPRLRPDEVPWIREVKPSTGDSARLVDISRRGLQLETTARLPPGRRACILLVDADNRTARANGLVVRTQLVAIGPNGVRVYRSALSFPEPIDPRIPSTPASPHPPEPPRAAVLAGPYDAIAVTAAGPQLTAASRLSETGCSTQPLRGVEPGHTLSLTVFFSQARALVLTGTAVVSDEQHGCVVHFAQLPDEVRTGLRACVQALPPAAGACRA